MQTQNLQIVPKGVKPIIRASQSDVGRTFQLHLYDGATEYTPPTGTTLRLDGIKPDKTAFSYTDNLTLSGSVITVTCKTQMTLIPGTVQCEIRMTKDSEDIGTINFDLMVEKSPINGTTDLSQTEVPALVALARAEMEDAEAWAAGTKDGVPVGPDDPQYHNNAKYWAEQISGDGQEAEAWAIGTKSGVPVPSTDPQYHNNAKYYAQEAGSSATTAGTAATNASSSAQSASTSANAAGTSASNAAAAASRAEAAVVHGPYIGANGNWYVFDFTTQQYTDTNVKAQGPQGPQGIQGLPGEDGTNGTDGVGIVSITKTATQGLVDTYTVLLTNEQTYTFTVTNGQNGTGSGDMLAANYDPNQAVYNAGGIVAYVAAQISGLSISLNGLTDVALTSLAAGQSLIYDATEQKWVNGSISASNVNYTNTTSGLTATKVQNAIDEVAAKNQTLANQITAVENDIDDIIHRVDVCYGFQINGSESNPSSAITYIADAVGFTPAAMDYTTGKFNYGSWEDAFFIPRPCMLKSDGTVDYYLDPDDYSKKEDGTASDIANTAYDGNAMMEWGRNGRKIWLKIQPSSDGHSAKVWIANNQVDSKFHDYSFHNCKGESAEHFYTPIYNGSVISSKMRSLSGQTVSKSLTGTAEITAAKANNPSTDELWNIECFADRVLINMLLILMGKSLNTQAVFGQGANSGGSETVNDTFTTGVHNAKGLFYGTNSGAVSANTFGNCVKVFGMENYYGFQWRRTNGLILNNGATKYKLTYNTEDGSAATGYNTDGTNYKDASVTPSGTSGNYISAAKFTEDGMFSDTMSGSASTYYCDATWFNNSAVTFARFGGDSSFGAKVGAFYLILNDAVSYASWYIGASVSCKPLA